MYFTEIDFGTPEYDEAISLRSEILRKPLNLEFEIGQIAEEWKELHLAAIDGNIIGTLTFQKQNDGLLKMRQVAVVSDLQNRGIGAALVTFAENWALTNGFHQIVLHARKEATKFYLKLGYHIEGEMYLEVGIPHFTMVKNLFSNQVFQRS
ncbi:MAG: GNAT family N-acetyltransferase [Saprospiraceae bacterium]|nr:GNAT family N-acetyltransferase [Saprospiraceae bacterium]